MQGPLRRFIIYVFFGVPDHLIVSLLGRFVLALLEPTLDVSGVLFSVFPELALRLGLQGKKSLEGIQYASPEAENVGF